MPGFIERTRDYLREHPILKSLVSIGAVVTLAIIVFVVFLVVWLVTLDRDISRRFAEKRFAPPIEFYSAPETFTAGAKLPSALLEALFSRKSYTRREFDQSMSPGDYSTWTGDQCRQFLGATFASTPDPSLLNDLAKAPGQSIGPESIAKCVTFVNRGSVASPLSSPNATPVAAPRA